MAHHQKGGRVPFLGKGIHLGSTTIVGHLALKFLARMGQLRRRSLRFRDEQAAIEQWLEAMEKALSAAPVYAGALAELPRLLKGYGETQARGLAHYTAIVEALVAPTLTRGVTDADAPGLRTAISAALADPEGKALESMLAPISLAALAAK